MRALAAAALLLALAGVASGDGFDWRRAGGAARDHYGAAMRRGDHLASRAAEQVNSGDEGRGKSLALRAVDAYEEAAKLDAARAEPHYRAAEVLNSHFVDVPRLTSISGDTRHPAERALRHWAEFFRLAPRDPRAADVLFRRSLLHTKLGGEENYRAAIADYEAQLRIMDTGGVEPGQMATVLSNAAEIHMALGAIDRAIELYQAAIEFNNDPLYAYGLAVALDRDDQGGKARELMMRYTYKDDVMRRGGVFFVPQGDEFYYMALGNETVGDWARAHALYEQYLRYQPKSPYAARAREHIARLAKRIKATRKPAPAPSTPERVW